MRDNPSSRFLGCRAIWTFLTVALLWFAVAAPAAAGGVPEDHPRQAVTQDRQDLLALMTRGKLEAELGNYRTASEAFSSIANDETAPSALRWEALIRLGVALSAAGDFRESADAFKKVMAEYSDDPEAIRFLIRARQGTVPGKTWLDLEPHYEDLLRSAEVVSVEELAMGFRGPERVYLAHDGVELSAIFRSDTPRLGPADVAAHEIAAYEMDKILGLGMVPPAVERAINDDRGSLQLWVEGSVVFVEVERKTPSWPDRAHQLSRISMFDNLIGNRDRNGTNILIDPAWQVALVDHTRSFTRGTQLERLPDQFDRRLVEKLRTLDRELLTGRLKGLLSGDQIGGILVRRDALLDHVDRLIADRGEAQVLF